MQIYSLPLQGDEIDNPFCIDWDAHAHSLSNSTLNKCVSVRDFSENLFQLEARPRWPLHFDCPHCLSALHFNQTLRPSLESSVLYKPIMSEQVDPCLQSDL